MVRVAQIGGALHAHEAPGDGIFLVLFEENGADQKLDRVGAALHRLGEPAGCLMLGFV